MQNREKFVLIFYTLFNLISNQFIKFYSDENYYWLWSKKLDFSYFDHPPMVAYIIKATTLFSDEAFFVRLGAALMVSGTAYMLYVLAKKMFDEKTAIYTFYIYISSVIIIAASTLMTPDIPLMFFTVLLLYSAYIYLDEDDKRYALLTGFAAGAMILSKYTGILIIFTLLVYISIYKRHVFKDRYFYAALAIATIIFSPVLYWNYMYDFISFTFQLDHGLSQEKIFKPKELFSFVGAQLVLFHPLYFLPLIYFIFRDKDRFERKKVYLLLPFLFVVIFFSYNSAFKYANAQWAGPGYLSASILLGYYLAKYDLKKLLIVALALSTFVMLALKTPLGEYIKPIKKVHARLGKIDNFSAEIKAMNIDIDSYDYILVDDYHGSEVAYYYRKYDNILVLNTARFSNFNIWRNRELGIDMQSPIKTIPSLGKAIYIGSSKYHYEEIAKLFTNHKVLAYEEKKVANKDLRYYFVEFKN
ncbi:MAG: glycosyltransferase family 39 protein [Campylobacterota bacterium]|nr:glycosyltransferase family 39 protein [Campylobacterota bacterium]